ncbi:uncharacterized protein B0P05DRAFT_588700 [Gilbertella persicaria]|uniref:uncharacterized protein n=1 Tax=Gilbertella persicaria TaxID=101096 RepID=UPI00222080F6|nr:uncharacterized protein B0P05DRAFT_588700 [Gilbertella persicaria]KAI8073416.1 hypothetical protein B0P05DRAFT_588700 [Gilbertella persicaria]
MESPSSSTISLEPKQAKKLTFKERLKVYISYTRPLFYLFLFDIGLPLALYYILKIWLSVLIALIISGIPPLLRVIYVFWKRRQVDILGCIFVISFILSAVLSVISGNVRLALLRDSTTTALISVMFFITLIPIRTKWFTVRPIVFMASQQIMAERPPIVWTDKNGEEHTTELMEMIWIHVHEYRKFCYIINALWAVFLMAEFVAKVIMIESSLTVDQIVLYGNIMVIVVVVGMTIFTVLYSRQVTKSTTAQIAEFRKENRLINDVPE